MAEGFYDYKMEEISRTYLEYDDYNKQDLDDEYDSLSKKCLKMLRNYKPEDEYNNLIEEVIDRMNYIDCL